MNTPALDLLLGAYFHQDWYEEHQDEWMTLDDFLDGEPAAARLLPAEIALVLAGYGDDAALGAYLRSRGSFYTTEAGETYSAWLTEIARRVQAATG